MAEAQNELVAQLQMWFERNCDGDWEHGWGVRINTLDNPGWAVDIHLEGTELEDKAFDPVQAERTDRDWCTCFVESSVFRGRGGVANLGEILGVFLAWETAQRAQTEGA